MIQVENLSGRRRSYRHDGVTIWLEPGEVVEVDGELPARARVRAFAESGLFLRPQPAQERARRSAPLPLPPDPVVSALAAAPGATATATIPEDWQDMPWPVKRALASKLAGYSVKTKTEAETVITAKVEAAS